MADYAIRHHPDVIARQISSRRPAMNSYRASFYREALTIIGVAGAAKMSKPCAYAAWCAALDEGRLSVPIPDWQKAFLDRSI